MKGKRASKLEGMTEEELHQESQRLLRKLARETKWAAALAIASLVVSAANLIFGR